MTAHITDALFFSVLVRGHEVKTDLANGIPGKKWMQPGITPRIILLYSHPSTRQLDNNFMLNAFSAGISLYLKYKQELERILAMNITKNALVVILSFVLLVSLTVNVMASEDVNPEDRYNKYIEYK